MRQFDEPVVLREPAGRLLTLAPMEPSDVDELSALYGQVRIGRDSYRRALDPKASRNFERKGGMFRIHDADSLAGLIGDAAEYVWVARGGGRLLGAFWCGLNDDKYADPTRILPLQGGEDLARRVARGLLDGTLYFSKEILVAPDARGSALAEALIYVGMRFFRGRGYLESCGEVYRVHALRDADGERPVGLFNQASWHMLARTGCRLEGEFPPCVVHADGFDAVLSMRIVRWSLEPALERTRGLLKAAGLEMEKRT